MAIATTCIGAFPKPPYLKVGNWSEFGNEADEDHQARTFSYVTDEPDEDNVELMDRATREAVQDQVSCGVDIPTDGEQRRDN